MSSFGSDSSRQELAASAWRRKVLFLWRASLVVILLVWLYPLSTGWTRLAIICLFMFLCIGALVLWWKSILVRTGCLLLTATIALIFVLPVRVIDRKRLNVAYLDALTAYRGTYYLWGGESGFGIDCSGLVRRGLIDASLRQGILTLNAGLIRESYRLRWFDCSANALRNEYHHLTRRLFSAESIQSLDHSKLEPGDLAVTADGIHTLAYLGEQIWIEADPEIRRVIKVAVSDNNPWLAVPVEIVRWRIFEP